MNKKLVEEAVQASTSYRQVAKRLGLYPKAAKAAVLESGASTAHFDFGRRSYSYVGKTYNRLTIQEVIKDPNGRWLCRCDCSCGTKDVLKRLDGVLNGHVLSCGCAYRHRPSMFGDGNPAYTGCGELSGSRVYWIKTEAARRGVPFSVSKEYLWRLFDKQNGLCALSGVKLMFGRGNSRQGDASLDRIDSSRGYVEGNVQWVHKDVNRIKWEFDQEYFLSMCDRISAHTRTRKQVAPETLAE